MKHSLYVLIAVAVLVVSACAPQGEPTSAPTTAPVAVPKSTPTSAPVASPAPDSSERPLPLAYWHLDGDGTDSLGDSELEFSGAYTLSDTAVSFDGYTGNASTSAPGPVDTTASFSVSAWVNYADAKGLVAAVSQLGEIVGLFALSVGVENRWTFSMKFEDRTGVEYSVGVQGAPAIPGSEWTHLVGVHDRAAGMLRLYVNGEEQGEAAFTTPLKAEGPLTIGRSQFDSRPGNFWPGAIGEVAVYQTALTAEQVAEIYQTTKPTSPPPAMPAPDPSTYGNGILNGTWDYVMTAEDRAVVEADLEAESGYNADELRIRFGFDNHEWWQGFVFDGELWLVHGVPEGSGGTFTIDGNKLTTFEAPYLATYEWTLEGDSLTTTVVEECEVSGPDTVCFPTREEIQENDPGLIFVTEHTWTRSGDDATYQDTAAQVKPGTGTLRLAVADGGGVPSEPYVLEFAEQVSTLSGGQMVIEPQWEAGNVTFDGFETGTVQLVRDGELDLGLAGARAFDTVDVSSFQALQAPYLIDNDALAKAVATSDMATQMLDDLSSAGMVGLTLWPEDLRHPVSLMPDKPILAPEDFAGLNVRVTPSEVSYGLIEAMGGRPGFADIDYGGAESGLRQGFSLAGSSRTATGNVTFFPKFQVLFVNQAAFERLTETQRAILRDAAAATQEKALAQYLGDVDAAKAWCAEGNSVVMASDEQLAAFQAAAQPVFDSIEQDAFSAKMIAEIRRLKESTEPSAGAEACTPEVAQ